VIGSPYEFDNVKSTDFEMLIPDGIADFVQMILGPDLMEETVIPFSLKYLRY